MTSITSGFPSPAPSEQVFMFVFYNPPMTLLISCFRRSQKEVLGWGRGWDTTWDNIINSDRPTPLRRSPLGSSANVVKRFHFCRTTYSLSGGQTVNEVHINVQKTNVNVLPVDCLLIHQKQKSYSVLRTPAPNFFRDRYAFCLHASVQYLWRVP